MKITQFFGNDSKNAQYMRYDYEHAHGSIYTRYNNPSDAKIRAWLNISDDYNSNNCIHEVMIKGIKYNLEYNHDLKMVGASSHFFSTIASFIDVETGEVFLVKETHANTYMCRL